MSRPAVALAILLTLFAPTTAACTDSEDTGPTTTAVPQSGIGEDEAIDIAKAAVAKDDPSFDLDQHRPIPHDLEDTWDVSFVPLEVTGNGGEPHAVIDRATGEVIEVYRTK